MQLSMILIKKKFAFKHTNCKIWGLNFNKDDNIQKCDKEKQTYVKFSGLTHVFSF